MERKSEIVVGPLLSVPLVHYSRTHRVERGNPRIAVHLDRGEACHHCVADAFGMLHARTTRRSSDRPRKWSSPARRCSSLPASPPGSRESKPVRCGSMITSSSDSRINCKSPVKQPVMKPEILAVCQITSDNETDLAQDRARLARIEHHVRMNQHAAHRRRHGNLFDVRIVDTRPSAPVRQTTTVRYCRHDASRWLPARPSRRT